LLLLLAELGAAVFEPNLNRSVRHKF
jgi:hypothetical protein